MRTDDKSLPAPPAAPPAAGKSSDSEIALSSTLAEPETAAPASLSGRVPRPDVVRVSPGALVGGRTDSKGTPTTTLPPHIEASTGAPREKVIDNELPRGASLGRYLVIECLGAGAMGVVYAAYDPELDRKVAIKLLRPENVGQEGSEARIRLLREAQAMARLQHPQVIAVYDVGTLSGQVFIAMEFIEGGTLTSWLEKHKRSQQEILSAFTLAGRGLAAAHAVGLVHRDFKPDNVLVGKDGQVRVLDFGLARRADQGDDQKTNPALLQAATSGALSLHLTRTGALMGTPRYMAPEQYRGGKTDARTDQFSFSVALMEALYGTPPFAGETIATLGYNVVEGRVLPPPAEAKVPTWMRQVLLRGLSVKPEDRFPDMESLLAALVRARSSVSRLWLITSAVVFALILANLAYNLRTHQQEAPCRGLEKNLAGIWDAPRKEDLRGRLLKTGKPYVEEVWQRVEKALDAYSQDWVAMRQSACMVRVRGEQTPEVYDLRMRCLDEKLKEVVAYTGVLNNPEEVVIEHASTAVHELSSIAHCEDVEALRAPPPLPENPRQRAEIEKLINELAEVRAEQRFGRYGIVIDKARSLVARAATVQYLPVKAEALYVQGQVEERGGMARQAEKTYVQAAAAAMQSNNQRLVGETWILLTALTGYRLNQPEKAESWQMLADAALETLRLGEREPLRAQLLMARCRVESGKRAWDRAIDQCQQALTLRSRLFGATSHEVAEVLHTLASIYRREGNFEQAMRYYREALEIEQKELGSLHPDIASELRGLGLLLRDQRRYREAFEYFSRALDVVQKSLGPEHIRTSDFHLLVGTSLFLQGRIAEAQKHFQRTFDIRERFPEGEAERRCEARYFLGQSLARLGHLQQALDLNLAALDLAERDRNRREERLAFNLHAIGVVMHAMGRSSEAIPYLERALGIRKSFAGETLKANLSRLAESQFALAQGLWAINRAPARQRATELALQAQANYLEWGNKPENDGASVTTWLAAGPQKPTVVPFGAVSESRAEPSPTKSTPSRPSRRSSKR